MMSLMTTTKKSMHGSWMRRVRLLQYHSQTALVPSEPGCERCSSSEEADAQEISGSVSTRLRKDTFLVSWPTLCSRLSKLQQTKTERGRRAMRNARKAVEMVKGARVSMATACTTGDKPRCDPFLGGKPRVRWDFGRSSDDWTTLFLRYIYV